MIQRFIELGEGYSDIYELFELAKSNQHRLAHLMMLQTTKGDKSAASFVVVLHPTAEGDFQPLYICREGITYTPGKSSKRIRLFEQLAEELNKNIITLDVKPSTIFAEKELYYQHLIGILRMNRYIPFMQ
ncbi:methylthioribose kinase [Bacillus songklensis]|uniref:Methylthioribose kinase n=1 Tax=Bacillus songklensis TaxID=1069116 RepID=A0ABV8AYZ8_9BACI